MSASKRFRLYCAPSKQSAFTAVARSKMNLPRDAASKSSTAPILSQRVTVVVAVHREALAARLAVVPALAIRQGLRTREPMLAEKEQEVELAFHLELALHLVDPQEMLSARRLQQIR